MRRIDGSELLLALLLIFFGCLMVFCAIRLPNDGTTFTGLLTIAGGLSGALCLKIKGSVSGDTDPLPPGTDKKIVTVEKQTTPPSETKP